MPWNIKIGDTTFPIDDFSADELDAIVKSRNDQGLLKYPDLNWLGFYQFPGNSPGAFYDLVCLAARKLEVPSPDRPPNVGKMASFFYEHIERVADDDLPTAFGEGGFPLPEADEAETTTSSTSTAPDSGTPSEPDELP